MSSAARILTHLRLLASVLLAKRLHRVVTLPYQLSYFRPFRFLLQEAKADRISASDHELTYIAVKAWHCMT